MKLTQEEVSEAIKHRDVILHIRAILATTSGREFCKYLFDSFEVGELPDIGLPNDFLRDRLGFLRAGASIFKLIAEANSELAGTMLAEVEKKRYAALYKDAEIGQSES